MDRALVEEITRQVLRELEAGGAGETSSEPSSASSSAQNLVACIGNCGAGIEEAAAALRAGAAMSGGLTIVLSEDARKGTSAEDFLARLGGNVSVHRDGCRCGEVARTARVVAIPLLSLPFAARIATGLTDDPAVRVVYRALFAGIPVVAARDGISGYGFSNPPKGLSPLQEAPFREMAEGHLRAIASLGIHVVPLTGLAEAIQAASRGGSIAQARAPEISASPSSDSSARRAGTPARSATIPLGGGRMDERVRAAYDRATAFAVEKLSDDPECVPCLAKVSTAFEECVRSGVCRIGISNEDETHAFDASAKIAGMIDHTLLKPDAKPSDIEKLCSEARKYKFASVCINPQYVALCARLLAGSGVKVCTVVGFPLGATTASAKASETRDAVADGADEIDMVINIGAVKAGEFKKVEEDITGVVRSARGRIVKVILETHLLTDSEKVSACELAKRAGAHFVKTSTGFTGGGATVEDISLMRKVVGPLLGVKASGGVRDRAGAEAMMRAGATRIGASSSVAIVTSKAGAEAPAGGKKTESKGY